MFYLGWLFFSVAAGMFAEFHRKRNGVGWFFVALVFSPLVAFVLVAILPEKAPKQIRLQPINPWQHAFGDWNAVRNIGKILGVIALTIIGVVAAMSVVIIVSNALAGG